VSEEATLLSGSHHAHSKLSPSGSPCWTVCTLQPLACDVDYDKIFKFKILKVDRLTPYLSSLGDEMYDHERRAIEITKAYLKAKNKDAFIAAMSNQDRSDIEHSEGSEASRLGTRAHDWAAKVLLGQCTLDDVPEAVHSGVKFYVEHCESLRVPGAEISVETSVPLFYYDHSDPNGGNRTGTVDFKAVSDDLIEVSDYKNGSGELVSATDNTQLAIYGYSTVVDLQNTGLYDFGPATTVNIRIIQPNHREDAPIKTWSISLADLEQFCKPITYVATQIQEGFRRVDVWLEKNPDGDILANIGEIAPALKFAPGHKTCKWCDRKNWCSARAEWLTSCVSTADASGLDALAALPDLAKEEKKAEPIVRVTKAGFVDDETLVAIYEKTKGIRLWLDDVEEYLTAQALSGAPVPGTKLVMGREGNRAWADEDAADAFLKNQRILEKDRYNFKLKSPTQIEELLAEKLASSTRTANLFKSHVTRSAAKPSLALASDKRPAISTAYGFDNESEPSDGLD
jgi:hypothetical protein